MVRIILLLPNGNCYQMVMQTRKNNSGNISSKYLIHVQDLFIICCAFPVLRLELLNYKIIIIIEH